jgi:hypothetical protein
MTRAMIKILINCPSPTLVEEEGQELLIDLVHETHAFVVDLVDLLLLLLDHLITLQTSTEPPAKNPVLRNRRWC